MENKKIFKLFEHILILSFIQYLLLKFLNSKIVPSFYLVYIILLSLSGDFEISLFFAFLTGIFTDITTKGVLGSTAIRFLIIVYLSSFFRVKSITGKSILIFIFSFLYFTLLGLKGTEGGWKGMIFLKYCFLFSFYNVLAGIVIENVFIKKLWKEKIF